MCDLEALISKHNKSVMKGKATYEPSRHTLKDYKAWETKTGKRYHELSVDQRAEANTAIDDMKRQAAAAAASKQ
ncbi:hypothetical protein JKP88DRAFT_224010 [Tribonema minus]|uniref:Uncharacterized protein n=1 Tax=Tribonema minus TaxID=303371 RepID=A0A836CC55_9STRA|nr:hypothetical protein JKP88DRAFT_224010 [Tribonema minus]